MAWLGGILALIIAIAISAILLRGILQPLMIAIADVVR